VLQTSGRRLFVFFRVISWIGLGLKLKAIHELTRTPSTKTFILQIPIEWSPNFNSLCNLGGLCVSVVDEWSLQNIHHRGTEHTEGAQRKQIRTPSFQSEALT